jgi:hypothetical protein
LAAGVAHDFNNVLSTIGVYSELLAKGLAQDDPLQSEVAHIQRANQQAASITQQLLTVGRRSHVRIAHLDLNEALSDAETILSHLVGEENELVCEYGPGPHRIAANPDQLEQILINLTINARDAMERPGLLTIGISSSSAEALAAVGLAAEPTSAAYVRLSVCDTGHGMPAETVARIFDPFFTTKAPDKGSGIGLAIVHGIVSQAGGFIRVQSEPGSGSRFDLYWPRMEDAPRADGAPRAGNAPRAGKEQILLVEDDPDLRRGLALALRVDGYVVVEASHGEEALEVLRDRARRFDLVVSDVVMDGMTGLELVERVVLDFPETKVLLISGQLAHGGRHPLLAKPFATTRFAERVRQILDEERGAGLAG